MKALLLLPLAACVSALPTLPYGAMMPLAQWSGAMPDKIVRMTDIYPSSQYHAQADMGQFSFGHSSLDQSRSEVRLANGQVLGHYSYIDTNGEPAITYYEAGRNGYRVLGSNRLPEAPAVPEVAAAAVPEEAKEAAEVRVAKVPEAAEAPVATEAIEAPVAVEAAAPEPVEYTKEVAEARADFAKTFEGIAADGPKPSYIDYTEDVANARADFAKTFEEAIGTASESA